jgi:hypothetical protein
MKTNEMKEPYTWMDINEVIEKLNEYAKGDEYQKATENAVFYLNSHKRSFDLYKNQMSVQKNVIHSYVNLLDDKDHEIDRLNRALLQRSDPSATVLKEGKAPTAPPFKELTDDEIVDASCLNDEDLMIYIATLPQVKEKLIQRGRALLKKASEK